MKTLALFIILSSFGLAANAQTFGIIKDKDGYVNVRKDGDINSPVIGKINDYSVFGVWDEDESKSDWIRIFRQDSLSENGFGLEGYVHKSRVRLLKEFASIKNLQITKNSCVAESDTVKLSISSKPFDPSKNKLTFSKPTSNRKDQKILLKINGKHFWGTDGELPKKAISSVKLVKNGLDVIIPQNAFDDLFEPAFHSLKVYLGDNNTLYIEMDNSDGAGGYSVIWIIRDNKYYGRYIDSSFA